MDPRDPGADTKRPTGLFRLISRWRWQVPLLVTASFLLLEAAEHWLVLLLPAQTFESVETALVIIELLLLILLFPMMIWWGLSALRENVRKTEEIQADLTETNTALEAANQRLEFLSRVNHRLTGAPDLEALHDEILQLACEVSDARGCAALLFNERGKPARTAIRGEVSPTLVHEWEAFIDKHHEQGEVCRHCGDHTGITPGDCPLVRFQPVDSTIKKVFCLNLAHGSRHFGTINLFYADLQQPWPEERMLLESLAVEMSLALENHALRTRELDTLYRLEHIQRRQNLHESLEALLSDLVDAYKLNSGQISLYEGESALLSPVVSVNGSIRVSASLLESLAHSALDADKPLVMDDPSSEAMESETVRTLMIAPIRTEFARLGVMLLCANTPETFNRRRTRTLGLIAGQIALLVENHRLFPEAERVATHAERSRLGREIHDGLAQTLSYLKLRTAQTSGWLEKGEIRRVKDEIGSIHTLLAEAYTDTREAIDGLRIHPGADRDLDWIGKVTADFESLAGIPIALDLTPGPEIPIEVQYQLQRIIQEALSNIRKHAHAARVTIKWSVCEDSIHIRITDDGRGFDLGDVPPTARHGLRIMEERATLVGASLTVDSSWDAGTSIDIHLPLDKSEIAHG